MADDVPAPLAADQQAPLKRASTNRFRVQCPSCKAFYRCTLEDYNINDLEADGSLTIDVRPDACRHHFSVFLDAKLNARSTQIIRDAKIITTLIRSDPEHMLQKERDLIEKHNDAIARNVHAEIEETWQELKKIRKEITRLGLD
ncbi:MAG: hypothetical protein GYA24_07820 [Candidatus Lokiarchaeota archaeon]|nr:hypothetical protein [Candidatus Lokiarchaeota archaeon]